VATGSTALARISRLGTLAGDPGIVARLVRSSNTYVFVSVSGAASCVLEVYQ